MKLSNIQICRTFHNFSGELSGVLEEKLIMCYFFFIIKLSRTFEVLVFYFENLKFIRVNLIN